MPPSDPRPAPLLPAWVVVLVAFATPLVAAPPFFLELQGSGLDFRHASGARGDFDLPEITCGAVAMLDYDGDGDLDLFFPQGAGAEGEGDLGDRLYRSDRLAGDGEPSLRFVDVTARSGLRDPATGCGAGAADYDNDGRVDLYVANDGPNRLWRNRGDGSFEDVTAASGAGDERWSVPVVWTDLDGDGRLDLFVGNYLAVDPARPKVCRTAAGARDYCNPAAWPGVTDRLWRNRGDGGFEDLSRQAGLAAVASKSLGAAAADFDGNGLLDLYVGNDGVDNQLWLQTRPWTFAERALEAGCAVDGLGRPEASMGVVAGDLDDDGDEDLLLTHLSGETHTFYRNEGGRFDDVTAATGLAAPSWPATGWGVAWIDFDGDGEEDLAVVNGAVRVLQELADRGDPFPFGQANQLFRHVGPARFEAIEAGPPFDRLEVSRGLARGDLDNDGDADLVQVNIGAAPRLLLGTLEGRGGWVGVRVVDAASGRDLLGTRVRLRAGGRSRARRSGVDGSYAASSDPRLLFRLGGASPESVEIRDPSGRRARWVGLRADAYITLVAGERR